MPPTLNHCAGPRNTRQLGGYVRARCHIRENHVLDEELRLWVHIPALAEFQVTLGAAASDVTPRNRAAFKRTMRTGTVASTGKRNWELLRGQGINQLRRRCVSSNLCRLIQQPMQLGILQQHDGLAIADSSSGYLRQCVVQADFQYLDVFAFMRFAAAV